MPSITVRAEARIGSPEYVAEDNSQRILTFLGVTGAVALMAVFLRIYVRRFMLLFTGADDVAMIAAMLCGIGVYICFVGEIQHGLGRHAVAIIQPDQESFLHWTFYHNLLIVAGICLAKISTCLLLIRLVRHRGYVWFLWAMLIFLAVYHVACEFTIIFACIPTYAQWNFAAQATSKCMSISTFTTLGVTNSVINIVTDVLLALLPIPVIMAMQLNKRTKFALSFVMFLGFIALGAGAVKLKSQLTFLSDPDRLYHDRFPMWAAVELYFAILAASLPTLKPLLAKVLNASRSSTAELSGSREQRRRVRDLRLRRLRPDDYWGIDKTNTYISECTTVGPDTPDTPDTQSRKDSTQHFTLFTAATRKVSPGPSQPTSAHSQRPSLNHLDPLRISPPSPCVLPAREREVHPRATTRKHDRSASVAHDAASTSSFSSYIVRTTRVVTTTEPVEFPDDNRAGVRRLDDGDGFVMPMPARPTGKRRSQSVTIPRRKDEWAEVPPLHIRKTPVRACS